MLDQDTGLDGMMKGTVPNLTDMIISEIDNLDNKVTNGYLPE